MLKRSNRKDPSYSNPPKRPFEYIAFWQFLAFSLLVGMIWANALLDLANIIWGQPNEEFDWFGACLLTAAVIIVGFITIAHTWLQQKQIISGLLKVCSYCHKIQIDKAAWERMEEFLSENTRAEFTHGICPACYKKVLEENNLGAEDLRTAEVWRDESSPKQSA